MKVAITEEEHNKLTALLSSIEKAEQVYKDYFRELAKKYNLKGEALGVYAHGEVWDTKEATAKNVCYIRGEKL